MYEILLILLGYLYGSIPFAVVIGKVFYNTDKCNQKRQRKEGRGFTVLFLLVFYCASCLNMSYFAVCHTKGNNFIPFLRGKV